MSRKISLCDRETIPLQGHVKILCIGDLHFRKGSLEEGEVAIKAVKKVFAQTLPDVTVLMGDVLHTHDVIYVKAMNQAERLIRWLSKKAPVYVLMGNHDFTSATDADTHGFGPFKEFPNVHIIDEMQVIDFEGAKVVMTPYVPYGKFESTYSSVVDSNDRVKLLLAHQPFRCVDPKAEDYPEDFPTMVSGHIHDWCQPQPNLYYTGSSMQVARDELPKKYAFIATLSKKGVRVTKKRLDVICSRLIERAYDDLQPKPKKAITEIFSWEGRTTLVIISTKDQEKFLKTKTWIQDPPGEGRILFKEVYESEGIERIKGGETYERTFSRLLKKSTPGARRAYDYVKKTLS